MTRLHKSARAKSLSSSLNQRLNSYALAAGAAGVTILAGSHPMEAKVINEFINFPLTGNQTYDFNPAKESTTPFYFVGTFINRTNDFWNRAFFQPNSAGASAVVSAGGYVQELASGALIGPSQNWGKGAKSGVLFTYGPYGGGTKDHHRGDFGQPGFIGFRFTIAGKQHYGWVRLKFSVQNGPDGTKVTTTQIVNCAFETIPGQSIRAGQTNDAEGAGSLGALALGSQGFSSGRK